MQYVKLEDLELYVSNEKFDSGHFHNVFKCIQRRKFIKDGQNENGSIKFKEIKLENPINWVLKKVKDYNHLDEVPYDIGKQYMAMLMANRFSEILKDFYASETVYLKYIQPYLAIPLFRTEKPDIYEIELLQDYHNVVFQKFNNPKGEEKIFPLKGASKDVVRLPHCFSHWTKEATDNNFMVTDV